MNRTSVKTPIAVFVAGVASMFLLMANTAHTPRGALWGILAAVAASWGLVTAMVPKVQSPRSLRHSIWSADENAALWSRPSLMVPIAALVLIVGAFVGGYATLPWVIVAALFCLVPLAFGRPGFFALWLVALIYLPTLGAVGLWDPWETHYGEVAREILARDDWVSLWWAQDKWFWSKPIFIFWAEALSMSALGVDFMADANPTAPAWAIRLPVFLFSLGALGMVYTTVRRVFSSRAGMLTVLVIATMPHFFFLARHAITDMPLVANVTIALCLLILAWVTDPSTEVQSFSFGRYQWSLTHVVSFLVVLLALPQALYLLSLNVEWSGGLAFHSVADSFLYGSAGNADVPGNPAHATHHPRMPGIGGQPWVQGLAWLIALFLLVLSIRKERRAQQLYMIAFYVFCALAFMAKGIPGIALPGLVALLYLIASKRWSTLFSGELRIAQGVALVSVIGLPWYVAMYIRHGAAFTNRLLIHDHINRLTAGVHGDKGTIEYFVSQLGYGTFPWIALIPAALVIWTRSRGRPETESRALHQRQLYLFCCLWFFAAFTLFSAMTTKFHHYIFPAVIPLGIVVGLTLDRFWGSARSHALNFVFVGVGVLCLVVGIAAYWGDVRGLLPPEATQVTDWVFTQSSPLWLVLLASVAGVGFVAFAYYLDARRNADTATRFSAFDNAIAGALLVVGACGAAFVGRDLSWVTSARPHGYERLIHLFVYNYKRVWPEQFDYRPILIGFCIVATLAVFIGVFEKLRPMMAKLILVVALLFTTWGVNVYIPDLSPHWSIENLAKRYYELRENSDQPLVAWQMNWKGENFYSGNRASVFVKTDNKAIKEWVKKNKGKTAFFVLEHTRLGSFRNVVRNPVEQLTTKRDNNKFILVKAKL